ncbi:helix-turn-helix domain-containing protein [Desulforamulus ruminis]|uniref:Helix-turn-helix domain protein n=1 Tax=Desulforamulus ruminis (strain ATCC 23193 / DSM 2154 / NCIMB 8452 / DL) TaxID=696281 RepID=F6DRX4_DESRL|nr:helix-turn-helix transcriptional regulator [Desulforamulus ruminis]AEG60998.1 helix-turn-helix domain protein [Desulforamulus ruminis DSM 2154]
MNLLHRIKALCDGKNVSIARPEQETGLANGSIRRWEKAVPSADRLQRVAEYFNVSMDYLLYGFDKAELTTIVNLMRYRRSIKEFAKDTGIDEFYLNRLCSGVEYKQPPVDVILKIATSNNNNWWPVLKHCLKQQDTI